MGKKLRIIYPHQVYPKISGSVLRSLNMAKLIADRFDNISIYAVDENVKYSDKIDGINIIQDLKFNGSLDRLKYNIDGIASKNFCLKVSPAAMDDKNAVYQIEDPYLYNAIKNNHIDRYILNEHNVYWEMFNFPAYTLKQKVYNRLSSGRDIKIEKQALSNASHIFVCSSRDKQLLTSELPGIKDNITVIPNCLNYQEYADYTKKNSGNNNGNEHDTATMTVLFMGLLSYAPNADAVYSICHDIAPKFDNKVKFVIVGRDPPAVDKQPDNVIFSGYVEDIKRYVMEADICIAPLKFGSGTRFKILEYMAMGKPVIATSKGAEGIEYTDGVNIVIEDDITRFHEKITDLLGDANKVKLLGKNASDLIREKYDWGSYRKILGDVYKKVFDEAN
ncbi:MAG TPA: glycosyltransferase family 4 protein [Methanocella sp.]|nr:glycosyltransferase family 4 protein [Methanocella sp.]